MEATSSAASYIKNGLNSFLPLIPTLGIGSILGTVFGYWFKDKLERNAENKRKVREARQKQYTDFLNNLIGFFDAWKDDALQLQFLWDVYANAPVYASDEVLRLAYSYIDSFDKTKNINDSERQRIYAKLVIAIRNELNNITGEQKSNIKEKEIKIMGLDNVNTNIKKQFLQNMHKDIKL